jgi:hypothetical protein
MGGLGAEYVGSSGKIVSELGSMYQIEGMAEPAGLLWWYPWNLIVQEQACGSFVSYCNYRGTIGGNSVDGCACFDCHDGYEGATCNDKKACDSNYCNNRGTIGGNQVDGCTCSACTDGYTGALCGVPTACENVVNLNYCNNHGTIGGNQVGGCTCSGCQGGYEGPTCNDKKACDSNYCNNRGTVSGNQVDGCMCSACTGGYEGPTCGVLKATCSDTPGWDNGWGKDCTWYAENRCVAYQYTGSTPASERHYPNLNCCACGKATAMRCNDVVYGFVDNNQVGTQVTQNECGIDAPHVSNTASCGSTMCTKLDRDRCCEASNVLATVTDISTPKQATAVMTAWPTQVAIVLSVLVVIALCFHNVFKKTICGREPSTRDGQAWSYVSMPTDTLQESILRDGAIRATHQPSRP